MFYLKKIQNKVLYDEIQESITYFKDTKCYVENFSEKKLFSSLQELYDVCTLKLNFHPEQEGVLIVIPEQDFSSLSKEDFIKEICNRLTYELFLYGEDSYAYTTQYEIVEV